MRESGGGVYGSMHCKSASLADGNLGEAYAG
jgi:hypothetical protein